MSRVRRLVLDVRLGSESGAHAQGVIGNSVTTIIPLRDLSIRSECVADCRK